MLGIPECLGFHALLSKRMTMKIISHNYLRFYIEYNNLQSRMHIFIYIILFNINGVIFTRL